MDWFRMYVEITEDPKVLRLSDRMFRAWVNLLAIARRYGGTLPGTADLAVHLRMSEARVEQVLTELGPPPGRGFLDSTGAGLTPHNWDARQYESDCSSERVRKYRERTRQAGVKVGGYLKHRDSVFARDGSACVYCGAETNLCLDHMVPILLGGDDDPMNLCVACKACNSGKAGRRPEQAGMKIINTVTEQLYKANLLRLQNGRVTVSETPSDTDTEQRQKQTATVIPRKPPPFDLAEHPKTLETIRFFHPDTDDRMCRELIGIANGVEPGIPDAEIARGLCATKKPKQYSAALWRDTLPEWIKHTAKQRETQERPHPKCSACGDSGVRGADSATVAEVREAIGANLICSCAAGARAVEMVRSIA